jgi:hypothetical protein
VQTAGWIKNFVDRHNVNLESPLPLGRKDPGPLAGRIDLGTYGREYHRSLFNKGARANNEDHIGYIMKETTDRIIVYGNRGYR